MAKRKIAFSTVNGNANNVGCMSLKNGRLELTGFGGLLNHKAKISLKDDIVVIEPDDTLPGTQCVNINEAALASKVMIDYFEENGCIDCLFVHVWDMWVQCRNILVSDEDT